jgi:hypothetical protein
MAGAGGAEQGYQFSGLIHVKAKADGFQYDGPPSDGQGHLRLAPGARMAYA